VTEPETHSESREGAVQIAATAPGRYSVRGPLTFATARRACEAGIRAFSAAPAGALEVDLSAVGASDSAGLAVLIEWLAWARRRGRELHFAQLPETVRAIARISEVEGLLEPGATPAGTPGR